MCRNRDFKKWCQNNKRDVDIFSCWGTKGDFTWYTASLDYRGFMIFNIQFLKVPQRKTTRKKKWNYPSARDWLFILVYVL